MATLKAFKGRRDVRARRTLTVAGSVLLHLLFVASLWLIPGALERPTYTNPEAITWLSEEPTPAARKTEDERQDRIVQSDRGQVVDKAAPNAFLGERTQVVDRETVNKNLNPQMARGAEAKPQQSLPSAAKPQVAQAKNEVAPEEGDAAKHPVVPTLDKLGVAIRAPAGAKEIARTLAEERQASQPGAQAAPNDYVKGMKESEHTALNTQEFMFFGYFQRIRSRLDLSWNKSLRDQLGKFFKRGRTLASEMDHTTKILVTLNSKGSVTRVQVVEDSGTEDLDNAAVDAFNQAGPFPNPPRGMLNASGEIQIRWDFVLRT